MLIGIALAASIAAQEPRPPAGIEALQGVWVITSINDQSAPEGSPEMTLTFTGDKYHQTLGGEVNERGSITIDDSKKPVSIDFIIAAGTDTGKTQLGIIEVTGDLVRASLDLPGAGQRPADFTVQDAVIVFVGKKRKALAIAPYEGIPLEPTTSMSSPPVPRKPASA
ncbi:MAG: TIGR03067 domain-containing protein [Vicinamibacterales bacterium]